MAAISSSRCELAWIAGVFEGEGYIGTSRVGRPKLAVQMSDEDVIRRLHSWSGLGTVRGPLLPGPGSTKPTWKWLVSACDDAAMLLTAMMPYLGDRRRQRAETVLANHERLGPKRGTRPTCGRGHDLSGDNLRFVDGHRRCLQCQARRQREYRTRKKVA